MVRDTSIAAYKEDRRSVRDKVLAAIEPGEMYTRRELAAKLGMLTSSMSGRIKELLDLRLIEEADEKVTCQQSGRLVHAVRRTPVSERPGVRPAGARTYAEMQAHV